MTHLTACVPPGAFLNGSSGFFSSPNFPSNFSTNSDCTWNISVPAGRIIKVTFFSFTLDPSHLTNCVVAPSDGPRVFITNVASDDGEQEFKICGARLPDPVYSIGNFIQVRLRSTASYPGFNASYEAIDKEQSKQYSMLFKNVFLRDQGDLEMRVGRFP